MSVEQLIILKIPCPKNSTLHEILYFCSKTFVQRKKSIFEKINIFRAAKACQWVPHYLGYKIVEIPWGIYKVWIYVQKAKMFLQRCTSGCPWPKATLKSPVGARDLGPLWSFIHFIFSYLLLFIWPRPACPFIFSYLLLFIWPLPALLFFLIFYSLFGPCLALQDRRTDEPCPAPCPALPCLAARFFESRDPFSESDCPGRFHHVN
jgi:hypothetical protein